MSLNNNPLVAFIRNLTFGGLESFGRYYSKYRAFVADVEDPENLQRIKLIVPAVYGTNILDYWAFPNGVFSGEGYGSQCLPKKGDMVWVTFEGGRPEVPIWEHGHFSRKEIPEKDKDLKDVQCYWFRTPKGNLVKLYDTKNLIHIENPTGNYTELNEKGISQVSKKAISLGTLNKSKYKAVLGEPTEEVFNDLNKIIKTMHEAWVKDVAIFTARGFTNTAAAIPQVTTEVQGLKAKIDKILSDLVTLDKDIT